MHIDVLGAGAVGLRVARTLSSLPEVAAVGVPGASSRFVDSLGAAGKAGGATRDATVVVLAGPAGAHPSLAREHVAAGRSVVSVSDDPRDVEALFALEEAARDAGVAVVAGAAFSPGLSCVLARHAADTLDVVETVEVAMVGAGGPACGRQRRRLLAGDGREWARGHWVDARAGSGSELVWFPDPIGARDCARGALVEPQLLHRIFPAAVGLTARAAVEPAASWWGWPGRRREPPDGDPGAVRAEVSGRRQGVSTTVVYAVLDRPAVAAAAVAALVAVEVGHGAPAGVRGVGEVVEPVSFLRRLADRGVRAATFEHR